MFSRSDLTMVSAQIVKALEQFCKDNGLEIRSDGGKYGGPEATVRLAVTRAGKVGEEDAKKAWEKNCHYFPGLEPWMYGQTITTPSGSYKIVGLELGRRKNPVMVNRIPDGKPFVFPASSVGFYLRDKKPAPVVTPPANSLLRHGA